MDRSSSSSAGAFVADLSAVVRNAGDQPALVAANEVEHVGTVMVDPAVNEELITCPDHRDVVIHSDQGIMDGFLASFGASSQSLDKRAKVELKNLAVPDDRRTTIRQKNLKHGGLVTLGDTVEECLNRGQDGLRLAGSILTG